MHVVVDNGAAAAAATASVQQLQSSAMDNVDSRPQSECYQVVTLMSQVVITATA